jgi:hypothetical protein
MDTVFNGGLADIFLRACLFVVGSIVAIHFTCMGCRAEGATLPWIDTFLMAFTATSGFAACLYSMIAGHQGPLLAAIIMAGFMALFVLRLWWLGFHACDFYKDRGRSCGT